MKFSFLFLTGAALSIVSAPAQWVTKTYPLATGWNGIWMPGDASYATVQDLVAANANITEIWRWNPNPDQVQFSQTPAAPTTSSDEWTVWKKDGSETQLSRLVGNSSYLVRCSAATSWPIKQLAVPPAAVWLISGANFLGFPGAGSGTTTTSPTLGSYLASYPSASTTVLAPGAKIYKYIGGDLNASNPMLVSPNSERLDPTKAYWFQIPTVSNFTAPVEYEVPSSAGLAFGRTQTAITAGVTNRSTSAVTLTVTVEASETAPDGQTGVTGGVPLTRRIFNSATNAYDETAMGGGFTVTIPASGRANMDFGVDRSAMTSSSAYYASILRIKDSGNLTDVILPVSAQAATTAGLWLASASVTNVASTVPGATGTTTAQPFPLIFLVHVDTAGTARLLSQVFVGRLATAGNPLGLGLYENTILPHAQSDIPPRRYVSCQLPMIPYIVGTGTVGTGGTVAWDISIPFNDPTNPFVHTYHPDHDNLDASFALPLQNGDESYSIARTCTFAFTSAPPGGATVAGWGSTVLGGVYSETLRGLNSKTLSVSGAFAMRRISENPSILNVTTP